MSRLEGPARFTQGWLQPARASAGLSASTAVSMRHATAPETAHRQRKKRFIAIDRLDDPERVDGSDRIEDERPPHSISRPERPLNLPNLARRRQNCKHVRRNADPVGWPSPRWILFHRAGARSPRLIAQIMMKKNP